MTPSTPASFRSRTPSSIEVGSEPRGGTISTVVRNSPAASLRPQAERSASGTGSRGRAPVPSTATATREPEPGDSMRSAPAIAPTCAGVVPQQPPTKRTPLRMRRAV